MPSTTCTASIGSSVHAYLSAHRTPRLADDRLHGAGVAVDAVAARFHHAIRPSFDADQASCLLLLVGRRLSNDCNFGSRLAG